MSRRSRLFVSTQVQDWGRSPLSRVPDTDTTPADLSPVLWLDASDTSTITESGGSVSQWNNKGSLGNFTQATGAVQPTTGVTTLNGRNVIDFAADYLTATDTNEWKFLHDGTKLLVAVIWRSSNTNFESLFGTRASLSTNIGFGAYKDTTFYGAVVSGGGANRVLATSGATTVTSSTWYVGTTLVDAGNATAANRAEVFRNAGTATKNNTATGDPSTSNPSHAMQIGADGNNANPLTGSIAEIVIVSGANATESNRVALRNYLNDKWAVY